MVFRKTKHYTMEVVKIKITVFLELSKALNNINHCSVVDKLECNPILRTNVTLQNYLGTSKHNCTKL